MKRRQFLKLGAAASSGVAAATVAAPAVAQSMPEVRWRLASSFPRVLDTLHGAADTLVKRVAEMTDNRFRIQLFPAGEIVPGLQVLDAVQAGTVECSFTTGYYNWGKDTAFAFTTGIPFGLNARMGEAWYQHGGGLEMVQELFAQYTTHVIKMGDTAGQMGGWFRKEINLVDDLKGLKFRIGGFAGRVVGKLGVIPQQIAAGDVYPALEKGTLDAVEWIAPADDEKFGFVKVAKNYYFPGWWEGGASGHFIVNMAKWKELPKSYQAILTSAVHDAGSWFLSKYDYSNPGALKRLIAQGAILKPFPQAVMDAGYKATEEACAEEAAKNPRFKKMYDSVRAFRKDAYQWWQVNELTFDSYQVRMETRS
ncbi:MAG: ABC transporter substrate-binding protein [Rhodospirillaceae bacterium]|nr:ABC transporter substrate-binding protein [Rhodospirillaceae bacterium]